MSTTETPKKRRISTEVDGHLEEELTVCANRTGLGRPEIMKIGLIKVLRELRETGTVVAETLPAAMAA